jgi:hypothetical protein
MADLQKGLANKIKRVQACIDARGHHFQHLLQVHGDFPNTLYIVSTTTTNVQYLLLIYLLILSVAQII